MLLHEAREEIAGPHVPMLVRASLEVHTEKGEAGDPVKPNMGLPDDERDGVVRVLNTLLADEYVLYTRTRNYHRNVTGPQFNDFHKFFEGQCEALDDAVDEVTERVRAMGGWSLGTLAEFLKHARIRADDAFREFRRVFETPAVRTVPKTRSE